MTKDNYREKVEKHRQEIELHKEPVSKTSRVSRHRKQNVRKQKNPIMTILVVVFIFIPLSILAYVTFIFDPSASTNEKKVNEEKDQLVEIHKQDPKATAANLEDDEEDSNEALKEEEEKERLAAEKAKEAEENLVDDQKAKEIEASQKVAAQKAKEQEKEKQESQAQQKTHTVQSTDNLYRIALKYYGNGSPAIIDKIKAANNLSSDSISAGQVLVIVP